MTPTTRTLAALRADGWTAEVVERWNPHARVRRDLFNIADILAVRGRETLAVQVTAGSGVSARVRKLERSDALPLLHAAGWRVEVHGWRRVKVKRGGKAIRWACRVLDMAGNNAIIPFHSVTRHNNMTATHHEANQHDPKPWPQADIPTSHDGRRARTTLSRTSQGTPSAGPAQPRHCTADGIVR